MARLTRDLPRLGGVRPARLAVAVHRSSDGRKRRSHDSQRRIVDALLALVGEGHLTPSAEQVSERAGVGLRSVFRHFNDMESLHRVAATIVAAKLEQGAREPFKATAWRGQLYELIERRAKGYERLAPFLRAEQLHRSGSPVLQAAHTKFVTALRQILSERLPDNTTVPPDTFEAIDLLLSFEAWQRLRQEQRLSATQARAVLRVAVTALLEPLG
jgi:AcrR family transcriptional regulator